MDKQRLCNPSGDNFTVRQSGNLKNLLIKDIETNLKSTKVPASSYLMPNDSGVAVDLTLPVTVTVSAKRHATESAMLHCTPDQYTPGQFNEQDRYATNKSPATNSPRVEDNCRQINITKVADKFLLGTMQALFSKGDVRYIQGTFNQSTELENENITDEKQLLATVSEWNNSSLASHIVQANNNDALSQQDNFGGRTNDFDESTGTTNKKTKSYRPSRPPLLPPCRVCGDKASGYHYGVNTCEACKGFFRRSICKTSSYVCTGSGNCSTVGGKRTLCSSCRFKRCLEVGMSKDAIKTGRYTHELRSKNILEVKKLERLYVEMDCADTPHEQPSREVDMMYSAFQTEYMKDKALDEKLQALIDGQRSLHEFLDDYYNEELMKERQMAVYNAYINKNKVSIKSTSTQGPHTFKDTFSSNGCSNLTEISHSGVTSSDCISAKCVQDTKKLTDSSINSSEGGLTCPSKLEGIRQTDERTKAEVMSTIITDMEQSVQGMLSFAKSLPKFYELPKDDQASLLKAGRFDVWYIGHIRCFNVDLRVGACEWQFHADDLAQVWGEDLINLAFTLSRVAQSLELTKEETAALRAVCLTFPDRCMDLHDREEVENLHQQMLEVLRYVVTRRIGASAYHKWFTKVIDFLMLLREFGVKFEAISTNIQLDWSVLKSNPLLLSVFLS